MIDTPVCGACDNEAMQQPVTLCLVKQTRNAATVACVGQAVSTAVSSARCASFEPEEEEKVHALTSLASV